LDVLKFVLAGFVKSAKGSAKDGAFKFIACVIANVKEGVHFKEKAIEDFVAIVLVSVAASEDAIRSLNASSEGFLTVLLINCLQLGVGEDFIGLTNQLELGLVHAHLLGVLHGVHLEGKFLKSTSHLH
jgi:hypothetical protein